MLLVRQNQANCLLNELPGEVTAEEPRELVVVQSVSLVLIDLEYLCEVVEEAYLAEGGLAEGTVRLEQDVLPPVALLQELGDELTPAQTILNRRRTTLRRRILVASVRNSDMWKDSA